MWKNTRQNERIFRIISKRARQSTVTSNINAIDTDIISGGLMPAHRQTLIAPTTLMFISHITTRVIAESILSVLSDSDCEERMVY
jgi:hypothetical protein